MSNEEVKEEVEKVPEEVEEVSKKVTEEVQEVAEEVKRNKAKFVNAQKLKCNYKIYKEQRTKLKMPITKNCAKCGKSFKDNDELYTAQKEKDKTEKKYIICKKCTK